jgi:curved DNA-binding protein CbpA
MAEAEKVDIPEERQKEILALEAKLSANHFEVLGVPAGAPPEQVRDAFHALSRKFHPDRFHGRELGSFKGRIDTIFKRLVEANNVLSDPEKRQAYLDSNPFVRAAIRAATGTNPALKPQAPAPKTAEEEARDAERRARLARHPYLAKVSKVQENLMRAKAHLEKGEFSHAFTLLNIAVQVDPQNAEVKALLADARRRAEHERSDADYKKGLQALEQGNDELALQAFKAAANISAANHQAAFAAAQLLEKQNADPKEISSFAQKAVEALPTKVEYRVLLGRMLEAGGMKALAKKHFEEALRLGPEHPDVKKHVKKRWPF